MANKLFAVYSKKAADLYGTHIYVKPDGTEVEITIVFPTEDVSGYRWDDKVLLGEVVRWVRKGREGKRRTKNMEISKTELDLDE